MYCSNCESIVLCVCVCVCERERETEREAERERESVCVCVYYSVTRLYADFVKEQSQSDYLVSQTKRYVSDSDRLKYWFLK